jgi:hypothetical protein
MQLLLGRKQSPHWMGGVQFSLWARFELTDEEEALIKKYQVRNAIITLGNTRRDIRLAALCALPIILIVYLVFSGIYGGAGVMLLALLFYAVAAYAIYNQIREQIKISDIIEGRDFACRSVLLLLEKEEMLLDTAVRFRRFLEYMKTWGGKEAVPIELRGVVGTQMLGRRDEAA